MTEDKALLEEIRNGDLNAFNELLNRYESFVYSICYNHVGDHQLAEEAAQDTFLKVYRYANSFQGGASVKTWLYRIAQRSSLDHLRKMKRHRHQVLDNQMFVATYNDGEKNLEEESQAKLVEGFLNVLDERSRKVVEMFYLHQRKIDEIALAMSMEVSNIKIILFRARKKMRSAYSSNTLTSTE